MNFLLFISLFILTFILYLFYRNILFPSLIVSLVFLLSSTFLVLNPKWMYVITLSTYFYIMISLIIFSIGCHFGASIRLKFSKIENSHFSKNGIFYLLIRKQNIFFLTLVSGIVCIIFLMHQFRLSLSLGASGSLSSIFEALRSKVQTNPEIYELSASLNIGIAFSEALGYTCLFLLIQDLILNKETFKLYILPVVFLLLEQLFSGGRNGFIIVIVSIIFDVYYILKVNNLESSNKLNRKILKNIFIGIAIFISIFWGVGILTGSSKVFNFWDTISIYVGSSMVTLDTLITTTSTQSSQFGVYTLKGIYGILNRLGFSVTLISNHMEMVRWNGYYSNVYTSFFPYIRDFGILPSVFVQIIIGFIFGNIWNEFNHSRKKSFLIFYYGRYFGYALAMYSIAERLFSQYLALNVIVEVLFGLILIIFFVRSEISTESH